MKYIIVILIILIITSPIYPRITINVEEPYSKVEKLVLEQIEESIDYLSKLSETLEHVQQELMKESS